VSLWSDRFGVPEEHVKGLTDESMRVLDHCRTGCLTQDHTSYAECLRDARLGVSAGETSKAKY
jgi:hypothetical protein